jgi:hypothetical protein
VKRCEIGSPLSTEIAAREIAAAWIEGALDAGIPRDAVPQEVDAEWIHGVGNAYWDRVAWSWRKHAGAGRDGYDVLARAATRSLAGQLQV